MTVTVTVRAKFRVTVTGRAKVRVRVTVRAKVMVRVRITTIHRCVLRLVCVVVKHGRMDFIPCVHGIC